MTDSAAHRQRRPQRSEIVLEADTSAVWAARRQVRQALARWGLHDHGAAMLAEQVATELVANAVRHAGSRSTLCISADGGTVTLNVTDESAAPPVPRTPYNGAVAD